MSTRTETLSSKYGSIQIFLIECEQEFGPEVGQSEFQFKVYFIVEVYESLKLNKTLSFVSNSSFK